MYIKTIAGLGSLSTRWKNAAQLYIKTDSTIWQRVRQGYIKVSASTWKRFFYEANLPTVNTRPQIRVTNTGAGTIYDGDEADSPQFLNADLFGKDGTYSNYTAIPDASRRFSSAATIDSAIRSTVVFDDRFTSAGGVTTTTRSNLDGKYLFYEVQVNNGTGDDFINPVSDPIKLIKQAPTTTDFQWTGVEQAGTELVLNYVYENYYYNKIDPDLSYIKWWRNTTDVPGGDLIKTETITATSTGATSTSRSGTSRYTPNAITDAGKYIIAETTAVNSNTIHFGYTDNYTVASFSTGIIGAPLVFSNVSVQDGSDKNGLDNRDRWPAGSLNKYVWTLNGYDASTTIRIRYRMYNYDTGRYYKISTEAIQADTTAGAEAAYDSYVSTPGATNYISSVSVSGTTATCHDYLDLSSTTVFNGGGNGPTWWLEIELSATRGIGRVYEMGYTGGYRTYYTGKSIDSSISVSPSTVAKNADVTISGSLIGYPATPSTNGYPRQYKIDYGDGTDSGWLPVGEYASGTLNPTYSLTKKYSAAGSYTVSIQTIPDYEDSTASLTVTSSKVPPTMGTPTISALNAFVSGQRRLSVPFTAVTDSGPSYQIFWYPGTDYSGSAKPPVNAFIDGSGTISPILDESGPTTVGRHAVWIRSSATNSTTGTTAPSTTLSDWSDLKYVYISGTRNLYYNKNTTDTVGSLPAASNGTDPWDGWVTTVSANTPTRTGHTFNGYNTAADGTGTNYAISAAITLTSDVTLYAKWTADTYAVTYYGNSNTGGSVPDAQTKTHGVDLTLRTNVNSLARTGYGFAGWNTNSSGTGTSYASGATYTGNTALDLYAKWASLYTITFDSKGGTAVSSIQQSSVGGSIAKPTDPTKTNNTFGGWTTSDGGTTAVTWPRTPTGDETLYAKWTSSAVAPSAPAKPTVGTLSYSHDSYDLATTLTRVSNTSKTQAWTYTAEVGFPVTWVKPSGATDFEIYINSTGTAPADSTSGNSTTSTGDVTTYTHWTTQSNRGTITRYFWVKAKNSTGSSGWSPVSTAKTSVATVVSGLALLLYRGNGTSSSSPSSAPASTALSYAWTGITNRGNPNGSPAGEGHYATVDTLTIAGTADNATSDTV